MGGTRNPQTGQWTGSASLEMVPVGNAGNLADPSTGYGAVGYAYNFGQYDVTAAQYTAFLNAVAKTDPYGLYNSNMALVASQIGCGISQSGSQGHYSYATISNPNFPVNYVSWGDAARFCNWLQNGQPTGSEGNGTTETGSYTLNGAITKASLMTVTRNTGATYCIPTEDEWYKAAYYNPANSSYYLYPTQSNSVPTNVLSATGTNNANYYDYYGTGNGGYTDPVNYLSAVGAFAASPSAYGTYDQGGDVFQWNEANINSSYRGLWGGSFHSLVNYLQSDNRIYDYPTNEYNNFGFRVSQVPEPTSLGVLGFGVIGMLVRRRGGRR
jgi:formylglycine-generating enzyme required for sulfatase activity